MTELLRVSKDICYYGGKGKGKSMVLAYEGFDKLLKGYTIYSNMHMNYKHIYIDSLKKIEMCQNGYLILDDLEQWLSSRKWTKNPEELLTMILMAGKRKITILYSVKRPENIDLLLRDTTDYWGEVDLIPNFKTNDIHEFYEKSKHLENLMIKIKWINDKGEEIHTQYIGNLKFCGSLYNTYEEIIKIR